LEVRLDREEIFLQIRNIKNLPTLPGVAGRILEVTSDGESGAKELAGIIANDQSMSAKVLNLANSAFYGFSRQITTIPQAVVVLGFDAVRGLALGVSVYETLPVPTNVDSFDREAFWIHSIGCGTAAKIIANALNYRDTGTFFVAGLLHDLGKVVLDTYFSDQYQRVVHHLVTEGGESVSTEEEIIKVNHAEVGGWLAFRWRFPDILVNAIEHHHDPDSADEAFIKETSIVYLADVLTRRAGIGLFYEMVEVDSALLQSNLDLTDDKVEKMAGELEKEKEGISEFFSYLSAG
jgi:putative nucleotidyltransferase with HDIG domain